MNSGGIRKNMSAANSEEKRHIENMDVDCNVKADVKEIRCKYVAST